MSDDGDQNVDHLNDFFDQNDDANQDVAANQAAAVVNPANQQPQAPAANLGNPQVQDVQLAAVILQMQQQLTVVTQQLAALQVAQPNPGRAAAEAAVDAHADEDDEDEDEEEADDEVTFRVGAARIRAQPPKPVKITGRAPSFCIEKDKESFLIWRDDWKCFLFTSGIDQIKRKDKRDQYAYSYLRAALSTPTKRWLDSLNLDENEKEDADFIVERIESHVVETSNPTQAMVEVLQKEQRSDESVNDLRIYFNQKTRYCFSGIHDWQDHFMKAAFIKALRCPETRRKLLAKKKLTYHECVEFAHNEEKAAKEEKFLSGTSKPEANYTSKPATRGSFRGRGGHNNRGGHHQQQAQNSQDRGRSQSRGPANYRGRSKSRDSFHKACGTTHLFGLEHCPNKTLFCTRCNKNGHIADNCQSANTNNTQKTTSNSAQLSVGNVQMPTVNEANQEDINTTEKLDLIDVVFQSRSGASVTAESLPDSGSNVCLFPLDVAKRVGFQGSARPDGPKLVDGHKLDTTGFIFVDILYNDILLKDVKFLISKDVPKPLLNLKVLKKLRLVHEDFPFAQVNATDADETAPVQPPAASPPQRITLGHGPELDEIANRYPSVFGDQILGMTGAPAKIELTPDAEPCSTGAFRDIPNAYLEPLKRELDLQVKIGILEPVHGPTEWLHPIVVVPKKDTSDVRLTVDFRRLNKYAKRPVNPQPTPWELVRNIPKGAKLFAVFDALKGYHQVPLEEGSRALTTFYTPFGKYRYRSIPMGYAPAGDLFTDRFGHAVDATLEGKLRCVEDCCIYGYSMADILPKIDRFFKACNDNNITLNTRKIQFGPEVTFAGFLINSNEYRINPALTDSLRSFPAPKSQTDLRSFMGLANQICQFTDDIAKLLMPFKDLLKKGQTFVWTDDHQLAFEKARSELSEPKWLTYFALNRPTRLYTDASRLNGLGFILKQLVDGQWKVVQAGSRFLSSAESRYAMIELELLAIVWAAKKTASFITGAQFDLMTDHKPLIPILEHYSLAQIENKRLQRLKEKINHLRFSVTWVPGKENVEADALSRYPTAQPTSDDIMDDEDADAPFASVNAIQTLLNLENDIELPTNDLLLSKLKDTADNDAEYQEVRQLIQAGFPSQPTSLSTIMKLYWRERDELHIDDAGFVCHNNRLLIPKPLRQRYLDQLVNLHQGTNKMIHRARQSMWWPHINVDIRKLAMRCRTCVERAASNPLEPLRPHAPVKYPFQAIHIDLGAYADKQWLIIVDQFSGWTVTFNMGKDPTSKDVVDKLLAVFSNYGIPETIYSDGGPQFRSKTEFAIMCSKYNVKSVPSSPYHSQSNGVAENGVKQMKRLIHCTYNGQLKTVDPHEWAQTILLYHNTPRQPSGYSPAQLLFGREIRDGLPTPIDHYKPALRAEVERRLRQVRLHQDPNRHQHELPVLNPGQPVVVQSPQTKRWTDRGIIIGFGQNNREYVVEFRRNGKRYVRNRRFLKPDLQARFQAPAPEPTAETPKNPERAGSQPEHGSSPERAGPPPEHGSTPERAGSPPRHVGPPARVPVPPVQPAENRRPARTIIKPHRFREETHTAERQHISWNPIPQVKYFQKPKDQVKKPKK